MKMARNNPWNVDSLQEFYFLKCPECTFDTKKEIIFQEHAIENHPLSIVLFNDDIDNKDGVESKFLEIKQEPPNDFCEVNYDALENEEALNYKTDQSYESSKCHQGIKEENSLIQKGNKVHKKLNVSISGNFSCSDCDSSFDVKAKLGQHKRRVHGIKKPKDPNTIPEEPTKCHICQKSLSDKSNLDISSEKGLS